MASQHMPEFSTYAAGRLVSQHGLGFMRNNQVQCTTDAAASLSPYCELALGKSMRITCQGYTPSPEQPEASFDSPNLLARRTKTEYQHITVKCAHNGAWNRLSTRPLNGPTGQPGRLHGPFAVASRCCQFANSSCLVAHGLYRPDTFLLSPRAQWILSQFGCSSLLCTAAAQCKLLVNTNWSCRLQLNYTVVI